MMYLHLFGDLIKDCFKPKKISQYASDVLPVFFTEIEEYK